MTTHGAIYQRVEKFLKIFLQLTSLHSAISLLSEVERLEQVWIPVEERLPKDEKEYLVITENFKVKVASYTGTSWFSYGGYWLYNMKHDSPTHWMELPKSPNSKL